MASRNRAVEPEQGEDRLDGKLEDWLPLTQWARGVGLSHGQQHYRFGKIDPRFRRVVWGNKYVMVGTVV